MDGRKDRCCGAGLNGTNLKAAFRGHMGFDHVPRAWWDDETICFMLFIVFLFIFAIEIVERKVSVVIRRLSICLIAIDLNLKKIVHLQSSIQIRF